MAHRFSRANPSDRYRQLVDQYLEIYAAGLPEKGVSPANLYTGRSTLKRLPDIKAMVDRTSARSALDMAPARAPSMPAATWRS